MTPEDAKVKLLHAIEALRKRANDGKINHSCIVPIVSSLATEYAFLCSVYWQTLLPEGFINGT